MRAARKSGPWTPAAALCATALCAAAIGHAGELTGRATCLPEAGPAAGVWITVARVGDLLSGLPSSAPARSHEQLVFTDRDGRFTLRDLPPGLYEVSVAVDSLPLWLAPAGPPLHTAIASVDDRSAVDLALTRQSSLDGVVRRRGGGPLVGARVKVSHHGDPAPFFETRSDTRGRFLVPALERGAKLDLTVTGPEGLYRKLSAAPTRAGPVPAEVELPPWDALAKRRVATQVSVPTVLGQRLEMEWISQPEEAREGFRRSFDLDRDGRGEFDSPIGIFRVRVREAEEGGRSWGAARLVRVEPGSGPLLVRIDVDHGP